MYLHYPLTNYKQCRLRLEAANSESRRCRAEPAIGTLSLPRGRQSRCSDLPNQALRLTLTVTLMSIVATGWPAPGPGGRARHRRLPSLTVVPGRRPGQPGRLHRVTSPIQGASQAPNRVVRSLGQGGPLRWVTRPGSCHGRDHVLPAT
jgi:hypothetical protein